MGNRGGQAAGGVFLVSAGCLPFRLHIWSGGKSSSASLSGLTFLGRFLG